jgi:hypothetical protein
MREHRNRRHNRKQKAFVIALYGERCVCCSEDRLDFLVLDHVDDSGGKERRKNALMSSAYRCLAAEFKRTGTIRADLQVLCANCSLSKRIRGGTCLHNPTRLLTVASPRRTDAIYATVIADNTAHLFDLSKETKSTKRQASRLRRRAVGRGPVALPNRL